MMDKKSIFFADSKYVNWPHWQHVLDKVKAKQLRKELAFDMFMFVGSCFVCEFAIWDSA